MSGRAARTALIETVARAGLRGRGGGAFPTARKLAAVAAGRGPRVVVANVCEGDPAGGKDRALLELAPSSPHRVVNASPQECRRQRDQQIDLLGAGHASDPWHHGQL